MENTENFYNINSYPPGKGKIKGNLYEEKENYMIGYTSNTNQPFLIDKEDFDKVKLYTWSENKKSGYIITYVIIQDENGGKKLKPLMIHNLIMGFKGIDHIEHNKKDNRKSKLRKATSQQNNQNIVIPSHNTSGIIGVSFDKRDNVWTAFIGSNNKTHKICRSKNKEDCIIARLKAEKKYYGEFAPQRHLFKQYGIEED